MGTLKESSRMVLESVAKSQKDYERVEKFLSAYEETLDVTRIALNDALANIDAPKGRKAIYVLREVVEMLNNIEKDDISVLGMSLNKHKSMIEEIAGWKDDI